jgi:oligopeptide transport system permease protein
LASPIAIAPLPASGAPIPPRRGWLAGAALRLCRNRPAHVALVVHIVHGLVALLAPWIDRYEPTEMHFDASLASPSARFWLGTDQVGRDQYSRLVHGARISLTVGVASQAIAVVLGVSIGMAAGMGGRWVDAVLMRLTDVAYAFPDLLLVILLVSAFGASMSMLIVAIALVSWMTIARLVRGQVLALQHEEYVLAARALGASRVRIAFRHLLPGAMGPVIVTAAFGVPAAIFAEAALSYIGLGFSTASWGYLVGESFDLMRSAPYLAVSSCLAVALTMMSFTFLGDGLRDALDPRSSARSPLPADTAPATAPSSGDERRAA